MRRVVVTGIGIVSPLGCSLPIVWSKLLQGTVATSALLEAAYKDIPCKVAATVPRGTDINEFNPDDVCTKSERRYLSNSMQFALHGAQQALKDSNWFPTSDLEKQRTGVCVGTGMIDLQEVLDTGSDFQRGYSKVSPFFIPKILMNLSGGHISIKWGFQGPNHCVSTACATGLHAIGDAFRFIKSGDADVMICGGTEATINPLSIAAFSRMRALSTRFNNRPEAASRPFDLDRDGFVMGEGAGIVVLEEYQHARSRHANVYAEILGYGLSADAYHITTPREDGKGAFLSMRRSLDSAGIRPEEVGYVNCHATSTLLGDLAECCSIRDIFQTVGLNDLSISSTKGATGHLLGAAGAIELIFAILACQLGDVPPTANLQNPDPALSALNIVANSSVKWLKPGRRIALKNSFGFGGTNASICIGNVE